MYFIRHLRYGALGFWRVEHWYNSHGKRRNTEDMCGLKQNKTVSPVL
jgi:hypothetical protein